MKVRNAIAKILKAQGIDAAFTFPTNPLLEGMAEEGVRLVTGRTERHAVHMADGYARATNRPSACIVQGGPGAEHAFPGIAQAYADSTPLLLLPGGPAASRIGLPVEFDPRASFAQITKWAETIRSAASVQQLFARAFSQLQTGRARPVMLATPGDIANEELDFEYRAVAPVRSAGDPRDVAEAVRILLAAKRPVVVAGQGVLWAQASDELIALAELLQIPVMTTLLGKSAFPENHPLALGSAGPAVSAMIEQFLGQADVVFAIGAGLTRSLASCEIPAGKTIIQSTVDAQDINAEYRVAHAIIGDAKLVLGQLVAEAKRRIETTRANPADAIHGVKTAWLRSWMQKLTSDEVPINPYRVVWELINTLDHSRAVITHDSGMPREQLSTFYEAPLPRSYLGWGNSHQLGSSLGLIMGAKLAAPERLAVHVVGDAGLATCGTDLETGIRERLPVLTVLLNNSTMAYYDRWIPKAIERYRVTDVTGNLLKLAEALGCYGERVEKPADIAAALRRCIKVVEGGRSALLEVVTKPETVISKWGATHL